MTSLSVLAAVLALPPLFVVPGVVVLRRCGVAPLLALYGGLGVTAAYAAAVVGLGVVLPWPVRSTCVGGLVVLLLASTWCALTAPRPLLPERADRAGVAVFLAAFLAAACFVAVPSRPHGTWGPETVGPGLIDTPRWTEQPVDNLLPYRTGQVAFFKRGDQLRDRFAVGWWISDRTPLVGLDFAFATGALGVHMRATDPTHSREGTAMQLKDPFAFWLYNLVAVLLSCAVVLGVYLFARQWRPDRRVALVAALVAALLPGFFLNEIYTWPKQATGYFVLAAAGFCLGRRAVLTGAFLGLAYLAHPVAVFYVLPVALLTLLRDGPRPAWWPSLARGLAGLVAVALPWQLFTSLKMHAISKLALWPLGGFTELRTDPGKALSQAWHAFTARGLLVNVWQRVESTAYSLFPSDLVRPALSGPDVYTAWAAAHGFAVWGMVGLVLFPATLVYVVRRWREERRMVYLFVLPFVVPTILAAGSGSYGDAWSHQSAYPLIGVMTVWSAGMLLGASRGVRWALLAAMAFELLTTAYGSEYRPYGVNVATGAGFGVVGIGAHLLLLAVLARCLGLGPPLSRLAARRGRRLSAASA